MNNFEAVILSGSEKRTITAGKKFAESILPGEIIGLKGNLGSGKTQFVKGIGEYFQVKDMINSPTFLIVNQYRGKNPGTNKEITINHFDLYRLRFADELETIGFSDYINENSICIIEWCELAEKYLDFDFKKVIFEFGSKNNERIINILNN